MTYFPRAQQVRKREGVNDVLLLRGGEELHTHGPWTKPNIKACLIHSSSYLCADFVFRTLCTLPLLSHTNTGRRRRRGGIHCFSLYVFYIHTVHTASSSLSLSTCHSVIFRSESVNHMQIPCCYFP
jgi:hypothetical protein